MSGYRLGIDLGTTYTAAAISRRTKNGDTWSEPEIVPLGSQSASVASVLYLGADGTVLVGEAAERRALTEPDRVVRQFKRRIGDDVPLVVGDAVHTAHELAALMARRVTDKVAEREGGPADLIAVTHPASWGDHKRELLAGALREVGLGATTFLPEPQAAAVAYAAKERVESGGTVAVYDLGGGTFDAAVVRKTTKGFELPGRAEGIEQLGGVDFDDRVVDHARAGIGAAFDELDPEDPDVLSALTRLRRECVEAKEALSSDTEVTIPVMLPSVRTNVRLTRHEFESMIRSSIDHTVGALTRTVDSAGLAPADLQAVLLVGGSSRIPLVAQMVSEALGRPVAVDADPKTSIAVGAVLAVAPRSAPVRARTTGAGVANAAAAAAVTSTVARSDRAVSNSPSSGLLDLRSVASSAPAPASRPTRTGSSSGRPPVTGPGSARFPAVGPSSGRLPVAPDNQRSGTGHSTPRTGTAPRTPSGYFAAPRTVGPASVAFRSPGAPGPSDDSARTSLLGGGRTPSRPPTAPAGMPPGDPAPPPGPPRSRGRLLVVAAAAVVLVGALTTGGVLYARSASVSATVAPPEAPATSEVVPAVVAPVEAVEEDPAAGSGATGSGASSGSGGSAGTGGSRGSGGSSSGSGGSSSGGGHGSGSTPTWTPDPEPKPTDEPTPAPQWPTEAN